MEGKVDIAAHISAKKHLSNLSGSTSSSRSLTSIFQSQVSKVQIQDEAHCIFVAQVQLITLVKQSGHKCFTQEEDVAIYNTTLI